MESLQADSSKGDRDGCNDIGQQASRWVVLLSKRPLTDDEVSAFRRWIDTSPEHELEFRAAEAAWNNVPLAGSMDDIKDLMAPTPYQQFHSAFYDFRLWVKAGLSRPQGWAALGGAAAATAALALFVFNPGAVGAISYSIEDSMAAARGVERPIHTSETAEIRNVTLDDGSVVTLGADSEIKVVFSQDERRIRLTAGEAFFDVTSDAQRPFIVEAENTLVRVVGTRFDVGLGSEAIDVAVEEGIVQVIQPRSVRGRIRDEDVRHVLTAGQHVSSEKSGIVQPVKSMEPEKVAAWRTGELIWVDTPIKDIVSDLDRYAAYDIRISNESASEIKTTLGYHADEIDGVITFLAENFDLEVFRAPTGDVELR